LRDLKAIYRLIGECRDLGADTQAWFGHFLAGFGRLVGAPVVTGGHVAGWSTEQPQALLMLDMGWRGEYERKQFAQWLALGDMGSDFFYARMIHLRRKLVTRYRRELVADSEWYDSWFFNEYRKVGAIDDCLMTCYHCPDSDLNQGVALHRDTNDPPFGERERRLAHWLHHELGPLVERQLASARQPSAWPLAPRLRQTLQCLLEGDSEKQAAVRLGLSRQTIHDYVKALYRHFDVSSRAELLALWIRLTLPKSGPDHSGGAGD
jgi:DNA-binding CsgD family transcriptional regulator